VSAEGRTPRVAAAPISWGVCELPGWGTVLPAALVLDEISSVGFTGTELGPDRYLASDAPNLRRALTARGLSLVGAFCPLPLSEPDAGRSALAGAEHLVELLAAVGCETLVAADAGDARRRESAGRVRPQDSLADKQWRRAGETLTALAERCASLGVNVVFHPHAGTYVELGSELDALMDATPADVVGLCLDTGHLAYGGADPVQVARQYGDRVRHVHLKDVSHTVLERVRRDGVPYEQAIGEDVFTPLGEGSVDFPGLVRSLTARGYDGWWVLEHDVRLGAPWSEHHPAQNAKRSLQYLRSLLS